jgi:hypothetical protein
MEGYYKYFKASTGLYIEDPPGSSYTGSLIQKAKDMEREKEWAEYDRLQENKYYTPDIEDIYIGYSCELKKQGEWKNYICLRPNELSNLLHQYLEPRMDGIPVRTPYLSKEQIEAEGWSEEGNYTGTSFYKNNWKLGFKRGTIKKDENTILNTSTIAIFLNEDIRYVGECKSINEFRKICKWLGISQEQSSS